MNRIPTSQPRNRKSATRERARLHHGPTEGKCSRLLLIRLVFIAFSPIMIDIIAHLHPSCTPALTTRVFPQQTCRCDRTPLQSEYPPSGILTPAAPPQYLSLIHISEPTRLRRISYAVFCLKKKKKKKKKQNNTQIKNEAQKKNKKKKT